MTTIKMNERADYGNWVLAAMMKTLWIADTALCAATLIVGSDNPIAGEYETQ